MQILSTAAGGAFLLTAAGCKYEGASSGQARAKPAIDCSTSHSVFCNACGPNASPKTGYDSGPVYAYFALWLMLTTEEWDSCLDAAQWQKIQVEYGIRPTWFHYFDDLYNAAHDTKLLPNGKSTPKEEFAHLRWVWQKFRTDRVHKNTYYPGYGTTLQIAKGFPQNISTSVLEQCGGGPAITTLPQLGPIAYWLMLTTENWSDCAKNINNWNSLLAAELTMDPANLQYLFDVSEDKRPAVSPTGKILPYSNNDAFKLALSVWDNFLKKIPADVYGGRPCAGGPTILQIAAGGK